MNIEAFNKLLNGLKNGIKYQDQPVFFNIGLWHLPITKELKEDRRFWTSEKVEKYNEQDPLYNYENCGTAGCIHGHAEIIFQEELGVIPGKLRPKDLIQDIADILDVEGDDYYDLVLPDPNMLASITRDHAIKAVEHLRDTGEMSDQTWWEIIGETNANSKTEK